MTVTMLPISVRPSESKVIERYIATAAKCHRGHSRLSGVHAPRQRSWDSADTDAITVLIITSQHFQDPRQGQPTFTGGTMAPCLSLITKCQINLKLQPSMYRSQTCRALSSIICMLAVASLVCLVLGERMADLKVRQESVHCAR